jgi:hypothetical protein
MMQKQAVVGSCCRVLAAYHVMAEQCRHELETSSDPTELLHPLDMRHQLLTMSW